MEGTQIRNLRQNKGLSLRAFGKQVGLSGERIRVLETYDYISPEIQERICAAFSVDSADPLFLTAPTLPTTLHNRQENQESTGEQRSRRTGCAEASESRLPSQPADGAGHQPERTGGGDGNKPDTDFSLGVWPTFHQGCHDGAD